MPVQILPLDKIVVDDRIQPRAEGTSRVVVESYRDIYATGGTMEQVVVYHDDAGDRYILSEGFHRISGAKEANLTELPAEVRPGTWLDAKLNAASSNAEHGLRRSDADKERAVYNTLACRWEWSDEKIAAHCRVSRVLVEKIRLKSVAETTNETGSTPGTDPILSTTTKSPSERRGRGRPRTRDKQAIEAGKVLRQSAEKSDEEIADQIGCKPVVVKTVRKKLEETGQITRREKMATTKADEMKDAIGQEVPAELRDLFGDQFLANTADVMSNMARDAKRWQSMIQNNAKDYVWLKAGEVLEYLEQAEQEFKLAAQRLRDAMPYAVCPICKGTPPKEDDKVCRRHGYVPKWKYDDAKKDGIIK